LVQAGVEAGQGGGEALSVGQSERGQVRGRSEE
jgi:hypothetical protein